MEALDIAITAVAEAQPWVGYWMNWMMIVSIAAVLFVYTHKPARYALGSLLLIFPIAILIFNQTGEVHLIGIAHLLVWGPLAWYLYRVCMRGEVRKKSAYGVWFMLFFLTICISLVFDVRDVYLVLMGGK